MKNNKLTSFILIGGLVIVVAFTSVITINLMPNYESNSYYVKVNDKMDAKVEMVSAEVYQGNKMELFKVTYK